MPKICFWNMRHLGDGTDDDRKKAISTVFTGIGADFTLFCELTTTSTIPPWQNLNYRRFTTSQLCYGCLDSAGTSVPLTIFTPEATDDYKVAVFKGGNDFTELADRAVGYLGKVGGVEIFVIHAPSGGGGGPAKKALSFLVCDLNKRYKNKPWLVIGDLNIEPDDLAASPIGIRISDLILPPPEPTYMGKNKDKKYDYVLCNFVNNAKIARIKCSPRHHGSDHYPIIVEF